MVVAGGIWMQNASDSNQDKMTATGVLVCRDNSYPFQERTLSLEQPVKIGRSVARARASLDNAIFDCKVLSRNHALLWFASGKFYLQDTKSSNGTFINNKRLSPSGEDSSACEVCSGDIVQFGVDVVESTKKVTHGCIVATLKLYLPDGKEAKASLTTSVAYVNVTLEDLYKLNQFIQEAGRREQALRSKLEYMQQLIESTRAATSQSWKALVLEDCLLSRLEMVENQLIVYSKNFSEDKIRNELVKLLEDKAQYQHAAKELLQKKQQEKREITEKIQILECHLNGAQEETQSLQHIIRENQTELQEFAIKYAKGQQNLKEATEKLKKTENKLKDILQLADKEKQDFSKQFEDQLYVEKSLDLNSQDSKIGTVNIHKQIAAVRNYIQAFYDKNSKFSIDDQSDLNNQMNPVQTINTILNNLHSMYIQMLDSNSESRFKYHEKECNVEEFNLCELKKKVFTDHICRKDNLKDSIIDVCHQCEYILPPLIVSKEMIVNGIEDSKNICDSGENDIILQSNDVSHNKPAEEFSKNVYFKHDMKENLDDKLSMQLMNEQYLKVNSCNIQEFEEKKNKLCYSKIPESIRSINSELSNKEPDISLLQINKSVHPISQEENLRQLLDEKCSTTLKPLFSNNLNFSIQISEYILRSFIMTSNSFKEDDNSKVRQILIKELENLRNWLNSESDDRVLDKLQGLHKQMKNEIQQIQEVNEQLVILKEKFNTSTKEKADLMKKYKILKSQCGDLLNVTYTVPIHYVVPIVVAFTWMLLDKIL